MDLEKMAAAGAEMPDGLNTAQQLLFLTLRELYHNYKSGAVNKERGHREKQRIMIAYDGLKADYGVMDYHLKLRKRLTHELGNLHTCDCEHCRKLLRIFDGVERRDIPEDVKALDAQNERLRDLVQERSERAAKLRTDLDRIGWIIDGEGAADDKFERIKEVIKNE